MLGPENKLRFFYKNSLSKKKKENFYVIDVIYKKININLDFQRFAAEEEGRTEEPTERRKREEREKGNVPRTNELPSSLILLGTVLALFLISSLILHQIYEIFYFYFQKIPKANSFTIEDSKELLKNLFLQTGKIVFPIVFISFVLGIIGNIVQVGFLFTLRPLEFQLQRIFPDFKRILPNRRNLINLLKTIFQVLIILTVTFLLIKEDLIPMLKTSGMDLEKAISVFGIVALKIFLVAGILLLIIAILDYFYQRYEYLENLKMTLTEVKQEIKEEIGDPLIRKRQRERALEIAKNRASLKKVLEADVIITNPTHYAVALQYDYPIDNAPKVIAKGKDYFALLIRNIAKENQIPIEENPPLAKELYNRVEVGQEIPQELYRAIILIYQKLEKFRKLIGK